MGMAFGSCNRARVQVSNMESGKTMFDSVFSVVLYFANDIPLSQRSLEDTQLRRRKVMSRRFSLGPVLLAGLLVLCLGPAAAQDYRGSIAGTVAEPSGAPLPGVSVTVKNTDTNVGKTIASAALPKRRR